MELTDRFTVQAGSPTVWALFWDNTGRELQIYARQQDWEPANADDVEYALSVIDGDVPRAGWVALAQDFLDRLRE